MKKKKIDYKSWLIIFYCGAMAFISILYVEMAVKSPFINFGWEFFLMVVIIAASALISLAKIRLWTAVFFLIGLMVIIPFTASANMITGVIFILLVMIALLSLLSELDMKN